MREGSTRTAMAVEIVAREPERIERDRDWTIEEGNLADYRSLSIFHYRPGPPTGVAKVIRLMYHGEANCRDAILAGVLVVSYPALWCSWHRRAWPDRFAVFARGRIGSRSPIDGLNEAQRLNQSLRMISRVVIDPRFRGLGAAVSLVRAYLAQPETPLTAALASMGRYCPFFAAAGMMDHELPARTRDAALAKVLAARKIEPWRLVDAARAARAVKDRAVRRALIAWHEAGIHARSRRKCMALQELAMHAGSVLYARPVVYTHGT
jgi:hypothetical protein